MRRWLELFREYAKAQAAALLEVVLSPSSVTSAASSVPVVTPGATVPCDQSHWHYDSQHARMCNELEAHSHGFAGVAVLAAEVGE